MFAGYGTGEPARVQAERLEMLLLLALGPAFQMLLSGLVAAAWSDGGARASDRPRHRPALEAALTGRLAAAAAPWLGISPDQVDARLHEGTGWGRLEMTGSGLRASLPPAGWPQCGPAAWPWWTVISWWRCSARRGPRRRSWPCQNRAAAQWS